MSSVPDLDLARVRRFCDAKVPAQARDEARIEVDVRGTSVTVIDCRAPWQPDVVEWSRSPVAQLRHDPAAEVWSLYWADRNSRWRRYDELAPTRVDDLLAEPPSRTRRATSSASAPPATVCSAAC